MTWVLVIMLSGSWQGGRAIDTSLVFRTEAECQAVADQLETAGGRMTDGRAGDAVIVCVKANRS